MLCSEIMQRPVKWISEEDTALTAARVMRDENIGFLPVCDKSGRVIPRFTFQHRPQFAQRVIDLFAQLLND